MTLSDDLENVDRQLWSDLGELMAAYADRRPVTKVAAVGNKPMEPSPERAAEIDSADLVLRANSFVLDDPDDPPCLGSKTHVVLLSRNARITPWVFHRYRDRLYLIMQGGFTTFRSVRELAEHWPADLGGLPLPNRAVTKRLDDLLLLERKPGSLIPTTGMTTIFLARELFPQADVVATGYSFLEDRDQTHWKHHFGSTDPVDNRHRIDLEGALLESWIDDGTVRFLT
jgi:hypothetical protein